MGYTHYWEITSPRIEREQWDAMCAAAEHVFEAAAQQGVKLVYGAGRTSPAVTNQSAIRLNGHPARDEHYEDCIIKRTGSSFCKTGSSYLERKPYDTAVVAVLNACSIISSDFVWHSDGSTEELAEGMELGRKAAEYALGRPPKPAEPEPESDKPAQPAQPAQSGDPDIAQAMQVLMQAFGAGAQPVDMDEVRKIISDEIDKLARPTRVEIVANGDDPRPLADATHKVLPDVIRFLSNDINVMLVGPAGSGKTTLAIQAADALERPFYLTGAILQKYELLGFIDANGNYVRSSFRDAYENGGVFLWDEMDSSNPAALVAFHAALENGHADFPDGKVTRHADFICIGAANTYGHGSNRQYVGRNALDGATLDRYAIITMDYDEDLERHLAGDDAWTREVQAYRKACDKLGIKHIISPRASIRGARMLKAGMSKPQVLDALLWKGLDSGQVSKIQSEAGFKPERF